MTNTIKFSVLISVYYKENPIFFKLALNSLLNQTLKPNEIVLVIDGQLTSELNTVIDNFKNIFNSLITVTNDNNLGLSASLAKGLKVCKYEYIARMDSDDISRIDRFEILLNHALRYPEIDIIGSWAIKINNDGVLSDIMKTPKKNNEIHNLIWTCPFIHPSVVFKKSRILEAGSYMFEDGPRQDDYSLWFRCAFRNYKFENLPITLLYYRFNSGTILKNDIKVGWARFKVGFKGCMKLKLGPIAFLGITIPLIRSLLPNPLKGWFYILTNKFNPRVR